jgi:hypothetical protein
MEGVGGVCRKKVSACGSFETIRMNPALLVRRVRPCIFRPNIEGKRAQSGLRPSPSPQPDLGMRISSGTCVSSDEAKKRFAGGGGDSDAGDTVQGLQFRRIHPIRLKRSSAQLEI